MKPAVLAALFSLLPGLAAAQTPIIGLPSAKPMQQTDSFPACQQPGCTMANSLASATIAQMLAEASSVMGVPIPGITPGLTAADGRIGNVGGSLGTNDLYSPSTNFQTAGVQRGWLAIVFGAGASNATLAATVTGVNGNHLTLSGSEQTPISSSGIFVVAPDAAPALSAALNNSNGYAFHIPAGSYCLGSQVTIAPNGQTQAGESKAVAVLSGDGVGQTNFYACAPMTTPTTNEAMFYRNSTFGLGGGLMDMTVDAAFLADEGIGVGGGKQALYSNVASWNGINAEWTCDSTTSGSGGMLFDNIKGFTNSSLATAAQEPPYNFVANLAHSNCTSITVRNSIFQNASTANIFDGAAGVGNTYINDHPFNAAGYGPTYEIKVSGLDVLLSNQLDDGGTQPGGGNPIGIDIAGTNVNATNNWCYYNGGYVSGNCIQIESGEKNGYVSGNFTRFTDSVPAANVVAQQGSADPTTYVCQNVGASYSACLQNIAYSTSAIGSPTGTNSATELMMGIGSTVVITPEHSSTIAVTVAGNIKNDTGGDGCKYSVNYGTGAAPMNGATLTGTQLGSTYQTFPSAGNAPIGFSMSGLATGAAIGMPLWFDIALAAVTGGTCTPTALTAIVTEQ